MRTRLVCMGALGLAMSACLWSACSSKDSGPGVRTDETGNGTGDTEGTNTETGGATATDSVTQGSDTTTPSENHATDTATPSETEATSTGPSTDDSDTDSSVFDADSDGWLAGSDMDCNDSDSAINPNQDEDPTNGKDDDCDGLVDEASDTDTQGCDGQEFSIEFQPTNLMILLDMSSSMTFTPPTPTKWEQARAAITTLVTDFNSQINFGLDIFPDDGDCGVDGAVTRDVAASNGTNIISYLGGTSPNGNTPLCLGIRQLASTTYAPGLYAGSAGSYVALVSDGADTCASGECAWGGGTWGEDGPTEEEVLRAATQALIAAGARIFVIGFGDGVDADQLNAVAQEGGTGMTSYLDAANQTELQDALASIASSIASCSFELKDPNASSDPDKVNFFFDGVSVPFDAGCASGTGWDWTDSTHTAILFCETACNQLKAGTVTKVSAEFGCQSVPA